MDTALVVKVKSAMQVYKGQGEGETKWKGWPWKLLLVSWDITNKKYFFTNISNGQGQNSMNTIYNWDFSLKNKVF